MLPDQKTWIKKYLSKHKRAVLFCAAIAFLNISIGDSSAFECSDVDEIPTTECDALVDLFNKTNGTGWNDNTGWMSDNTPCDWFGVTCKDGYIVQINLDSNGLENELPDS